MLIHGTFRPHPVRNRARAIYRYSVLGNDKNIQAIICKTIPIKNKTR